MSSDPIGVLCVDDHAFLADGLRIRIEAEPDMRFLGHLDSADRLLETVLRLRPQVVLLDIDMPGRDPFDALLDLRRDASFTRPVMLSAHVRERYIDLAYKSGAWGYLCKADSPDAIIAGIREVAAGRVASSPSVQERFQPGGGGDRDAVRTRLQSMTRRELEVLRMIARGMGRAEIAAALHRSPMTVDNHRKSLMKKLDIHDRGELIRFAIAEGLVEP
jgi:DNA-binding NarL/FixJ family response regulator